MKRNKGFTLIELLAVIVILAIIALIATPIVLNIIKDSKENAGLRSAEFYLDAVEQSITKKMMDDPTFKPNSCDVQSDGNLKCDGKDNIIEVEVSGETPTSGTIKLEQGKIKDVELVLSEKTIVKNTEGKLVYGEAEAQLESGLYDEEDNLIATWDELVNDYGIDLESDYMGEDGVAAVDPSELPGIILTNEKLSRGTKLIIDSSVKILGSGALGMNTSLKEVIIPNSVTSICEYTFNGCTSLKEIIIPNSVTNIGQDSFAYCPSLEKITIPNSVTYIGGWAFVDCTSLNTINYTGTQAQWNNISKDSSWDLGTPSNKVINYNYEN